MRDLEMMWRASVPGRTVVGRHLLRHASYLVLVEAGRPLRVSDIVGRLAAAGYVTWRPPSRAVSDLLRTEVRAGRVERPGRGVYQLAAPPDPGHLRYITRALSELPLAPARRSASGRAVAMAGAMAGGVADGMAAAPGHDMPGWRP